MARILIIDDSATEVVTFSRMLQSYGHETLSSSSAEEGLDKARAEIPDLILMDVIMPGMNGFQATRRLSRDPKTSAIPIIIITAKDQETDRIWGLRQGARDYVVKPIKESDLVGKISALLESSA